LLKSSSGNLLIVDAGTGIMRLGERVMAGSGKAAIELNVLLTHFHLDHIIGLPFFAPLYSSRAAIVFHSPVEPKETEKYLAGLQMGRYFPVSFRETASRKKILKANESGFKVSGFRISCRLTIRREASPTVSKRRGSVVLPRTLNLPTAAWTAPGLLHPRATCFVCDATFLSGNTGSGGAGRTHLAWGTSSPGRAASGTLCFPASGPR
jgi:hypothetical protein